MVHKILRFRILLFVVVVVVAAVVVVTVVLIYIISEVKLQSLTYHPQQDLLYPCLKVFSAVGLCFDVLR
jgi:hypothetical protein